MGRVSPALLKVMEDIQCHLPYLLHKEPVWKKYSITTSWYPLWNSGNNDYIISVTSLCFGSRQRWQKDVDQTYCTITGIPRIPKQSRDYSRFHCCYSHFLFLPVEEGLNLAQWTRGFSLWDDEVICHLKAEILRASMNPSSLSPLPRCYLREKQLHARP